MSEYKFYLGFIKMLKFNELRAKFQAFPFHLVQESLWPIVMSSALFNLVIAFVLYMHGFPNGGFLTTFNFSLVLIVMSFWFRDVITESTLQVHHTKEVKKGLVLGFLLFVVSEVMAFASVF